MSRPRQGAQLQSADPLQSLAKYRFVQNGTHTLRTDAGDAGSFR
jgi:hypothetical protein